MGWFKDKVKKVTNVVKDPVGSLQDAYDVVTPWDTPREQRKDREDLTGDLQDVADDINRIDPYDINWDTGKVYDSQGNLVKDYSDYYAQIDQAKATNIPSMDEWMSENEYSFNDPMAKDSFGNFITPAMQNITQLTEELRSGPSETDLSEADAYAARQMGMTNEEYQARMDDLAAAVEGGIGGMEGMSEEERELRERAQRNELREMEIRASRQIENIQANTGSASRSLAAADEAMRSINDAQIQQQVALADETFRRQTMEYEAQQHQWQQMVQSGQMARSEYLQLVQNSKAQAFKGYALQIDTMFQQNQEYLQRYQADLQSVGMALDNTYKAIATEMGVDANMMNFVEQQYNMEIAPLLAQLDIEMQEAQLNLASDQAAFDFIDFLELGLEAASIAVSAA